MECEQRAAGDLVRANEMRDVGALIFLAHQAFARCIDRAFLAQQRRFIEIHAAFVCVLPRRAHRFFYSRTRCRGARNASAPCSRTCPRRPDDELNVLRCARCRASAAASFCRATGSPTQNLPRLDPLIRRCRRRCRYPSNPSMRAIVRAPSLRKSSKSAPCTMP